MRPEPAERARVSGLLADATAILERAGVESPRLDAELLLAEAAGCTRERVLAGLAEISADGSARFAEMLARRAAREPLAYIVGHKEFYSIDLEVTPAVLIPRPETETVVAAALEFIARRPAARILDLGTGSGAIAIAIAVNAPGASVTATDISDSALAVARRNATCAGVAARVALRRADCFDVRDGGAQLGRFDLIVSNPPYVGALEAVRLAPEITHYEPALAVSAGGDGLAIVRRIAAGARARLERSGALMVEVGAGQADAVAALFRDAGLSRVGVINDLAGIPRVVRGEH
jgi:release factor glutamine methyltransferase